MRKDVAAFVAVFIDNLRLNFARINLKQKQVLLAMKSRSKVAFTDGCSLAYRPSYPSFSADCITVSKFLLKSLITAVAEFPSGSVAVAVMLCLPLVPNSGMTAATGVSSENSPCSIARSTTTVVNCLVMDIR